MGLIAGGRKKRSLPVPGTTGLVPGFAAEAQWYQQQLAQIALLAGRKKRSAQIGINLPVSGTIPGLVPGSLAEAQWKRREVFQFQVQLDLFQDLPLRLNGTSNNLHKLPSLLEEGREVFQFPELPDLSQDLPLRLSGTLNSSLNSL